MRRDFKEVIVETGRHGGINKGRNKNWKRGFDPQDEYFDGGPIRTPMLSRKWDRKSQGDKLNPLRGFLRSRIGHSWDGVFSEICGANDKRSMLGFHLLTHLSQIVGASGLNRTRFLHRSFNFYVDTSGILRENPSASYWRARERARAQRERIEQFFKEMPCSDGWTYKNIEGIWFKFRTEKFMLPFSSEYLAEENGEVIIKRTPQKMVEHSREYKFQCGKKDLRWIREQLKRILAS